MAERDGDFGAFLAGFIIGGMVGSIIALLLAPSLVRRPGRSFEIEASN